MNQRFRTLFQKAEKGFQQQKEKPHFWKKTLALSMAGVLVLSQVPRQIENILADADAGRYMGSAINMANPSFTVGNMSGMQSQTVRSAILRLSASVETKEAWKIGYDQGLHPDIKTYGLFMGDSSSGAGLRTRNFAYVGYPEGSSVIAYAANHPGYATTSALGTDNSFQYHEDILNKLSKILYDLYLSKGSYNGNTKTLIGGKESDGLVSSLSSEDIAAIEEAMLKAGATTEQIDKLMKYDDGVAVTSIRVSQKDREDMDASMLKGIDLGAAVLATQLMLQGWGTAETGISNTEVFAILTGENNTHHFNICLENAYVVQDMTTGVSAWMIPRMYYELFAKDLSVDMLGNATSETFTKLIPSNLLIYNDSMKSFTRNPSDQASSEEFHVKTMRYFYSRSSGTDGTMWDAFARTIAYWRAPLYGEDDGSGNEPIIWSGDYETGGELMNGEEAVHNDPSLGIWNLNVIANATPDGVPVLGTGIHQLHSIEPVIEAEVNQTITANQHIDFRQDDAAITEILKTFKSAYDAAELGDSGEASIVFTNILYKTDRTGIDEATYYEFDHTNEYEPSNYEGAKPTPVRDTDMFVPFSLGASAGGGSSGSTTTPDDSGSSDTTTTPDDSGSDDTTTPDDSGSGSDTTTPDDSGSSPLQHPKHL